MYIIITISLVLGGIKITQHMLRKSNSDWLSDVTRFIDNKRRESGSNNIEGMIHIEPLIPDDRSDDYE